MTRLLLMRHARARQAEHQSEGHLFSVGDTPLSEEGQVQARRAGEMIANAPGEVASVHASPAKRSAETARIVAKALPGDHEVTTHEGLVEVPYAEPGAHYDEVLATIADTARRLREDPDPQLPTGTSWGEATSRFADTLERIVQDSPAPLVVAHGAQNRAWLTEILEMPPHRLFALEQDHACVNVVYAENGRRALAKLNVTVDPLASEQASLEG